MTDAPESTVRFHAGLTASEWEILMDRQRRLEEGAIELGRQKFTERVDEANRSGRAAEEGAALTLMRKLVVNLADGIEVWRAGIKTRRPVALAVVERIGVADAAYIAARRIVNRMHTEVTFLQLSTEIAGDITRELRLRRFQEKAPGLFKYKMRSFVGSSPVHVAKSLASTMAGAICDECRAVGLTVERAECCPHLDMSDLELSSSDSVHVGGKLIDLFIATSGLVEKVSRQGRPAVSGRGAVTHDRQLLILPSPDGLKLLAERNKALADMFPPSLPMVVPPLSWAPGRRGGYRFAMSQRDSFVRGQSKRFRTELEAANMPSVYEAVNAVQSTAFRINRPVLELMKEVAERGGERAGLPRTQTMEIPGKPSGTWATEDERKADPAWRAWRKTAAQAHDAESRRIGAARVLFRTLDAAERVADETAVWFPYNLDFRGRVYPIADTLSPQGDDRQKGLLMFAEGKPLGPNGSGWLAMHGANCLGEWDGQKMSKLTLQERVDVIQGLTLRIVAAAEDPWGETFWMEADEPWAFYAFCREWAGFYRLWTEGRGEEYVCALPVSVDGTCNGLQVFSGLFLDEVGAASVNVSPAERPQDVYDRIAQTVQERVELEAPENDVAYLWLTSGLIGRNLTKRPTMTFGYGSRPRGFADQIREWLGEDARQAQTLAHFQTTGEDGKPKDARFPACVYMANLIWDALQGVVVKAFEGMEWFKQAARVVARSNQPVRWTVPGTGFPVVQARRDYFICDEKKVKTVLCGSFVYPRVYTETDKVDTRKQASAISPNVIHSLDAALLMLTVVECARLDGSMSFAMVHDSYGTLPADMTLLSATLREQFVRLFGEQDVAAGFWKEWQEQAPEGEDVPMPPSKGALDLSDVRNSDYFFC